MECERKAFDYTSNRTKNLSDGPEDNEWDSDKKTHEKNNNFK